MEMKFVDVATNQTRNDLLFALLTDQEKTLAAKYQDARDVRGMVKTEGMVGFWQGYKAGILAGIESQRILRDHLVSLTE